ncbi:MAG: helix-hairpin-helix domain-containing protein, partial [Pseudomonadota bacterium]|nr:helix-hairpin-helix domain-containing protein [Pseudomonadota bacterium]
MSPTVISALSEIADLLEAQRANTFRVRAYRRAAETVATLPRDIADQVADEGFDGLIRLPGIGRGIA